MEIKLHNGHLNKCVTIRINTASSPDLLVTLLPVNVYGLFYGNTGINSCARESKINGNTSIQFI